MSDEINAKLKGAYAKMQESESTPTAKKFSVTDDHSKEVKPNTRDMGSEAGSKEVGDDHGSKKAVEGAHSNGRKEGSAAGAAEVGDDHGSKKAVEGANPVPRKEGSGSAVDSYGDFRKKVRNMLGLVDRTDHKLNKPNDGLNK